MLEKPATFFFRKSNADSRFLQNSGTYLHIGTQYHIPEDHNLKTPIVFAIFHCLWYILYAWQHDILKVCSTVIFT